jgi:hypothetical protein
MNGISPQLEATYKLAEEFYEKRNALGKKIETLLVEQAEVSRLYDQVVAHARDLEYQQTEAEEDLKIKVVTDRPPVVQLICGNAPA